MAGTEVKTLELRSVARSAEISKRPDGDKLKGPRPTPLQTTSFAHGEEPAFAGSTRVRSWRGVRSVGTAARLFVALLGRRDRWARRGLLDALLGGRVRCDILRKRLARSGANVRGHNPRGILRGVRARMILAQVCAKHLCVDPDFGRQLLRRHRFGGCHSVVPFGQSIRMNALDREPMRAHTAFATENAERANPRVRRGRGAHYMRDRCRLGGGVRVRVHANDDTGTYASRQMSFDVKRLNVCICDNDRSSLPRTNTYSTMTTLSTSTTRPLPTHEGGIDVVCVRDKRSEKTVDFSVLTMPTYGVANAHW